MNNEIEYKTEDSLIECPTEENLPEEYVNQEIEDVEADFESASTNYRDLIERGFDTLDVIKEILADTEHPRSAEVLSNTLKIVADMNKDLVGLHKIKREAKAAIMGERPTGEGVIENQNNQQNIFVGSSADLQRMLKGMPV